MRLGAPPASWAVEQKVFGGERSLQAPAQVCEPEGGSLFAAAFLVTGQSPGVGGECGEGQRTVFNDIAPKAAARSRQHTTQLRQPSI